MDNIYTNSHAPHFILSQERMDTKNYIFFPQDWIDQEWPEYPRKEKILQGQFVCLFSSFSNKQAFSNVTKSLTGKV